MISYSVLENKVESLKASVIVKGQRVETFEHGNQYDYYDLASLTKILFTNILLMKAYEQNPALLNQRLQDILPWCPYKKVTIRDLLSHSSGLRAWAPFYKNISEKLNLIEKRSNLKSLLKQEKISSAGTVQYSDIGYMYLGFVLERIFEKPLSSFLIDITKELNCVGLHFCEENQPLHKKSDYAPTEFCELRGKRLQGEVHDHNTWSLGGVSTHAGLFGRIEDVENWFFTLRKVYLGEATAFGISQPTVKTFFEEGEGCWSLGFMRPNKGDDSTAGSCFSKKSVGHTGFTGTSFWYDVEQDLAVVILANRVYFGSHTEFLNVRQNIHTAAYRRHIL